MELFDVMREIGYLNRYEAQFYLGSMIIGAASRTFTVIGTPIYMAPEIIQGKGYILTVDLWSIGVCLYEFICGIVPFGEGLEDAYEIYEEILFKKLSYPVNIDPLEKNLMEQLLTRVPEKRLGGSFANLKSHPWFETFDWDKLVEHALDPPYKPSEENMLSQEDVEVGFFQNVPALEEIMSETPKFNKQKPIDLKSTIYEWDKDF